jgi:hypothetical protein
MNCATRPRGSISDGFFAGARVCEVAIRRQAGLRGSGGGAGLLPTTRRALLPAIAVIFVPLARRLGGFVISLPPNRRVRPREAIVIYSAFVLTNAHYGGRFILVMRTAPERQ